MSRKLDEWSSRIKAVEREYRAVRFAIERLKAEVKRDPALLAKAGAVRDLNDASNHLEGTYIIRIFSEFETGLRQYWETLRTTHPKTQDLIESIGARRQIPSETIEKVHSIREYRNDLVHNREVVVKPVELSNARGSLCIFLSRLPPDW